MGIQKKSKTYEEFVEKFKPKKTTDDCYTPPNIYDVVAGYVTETYGIAREDMVRPFYPGGDYENFDYPDGCCVVDNPPFSIISKICKDYIKAGIRFFLFCPYLVGANITKATEKAVTLIVAPVDVEYENGAQIHTAFVTNLEPGTVLRTAPELLDRLEAANKENIARVHPALPKYEYPPEILTLSAAGIFAKRHVPYRLEASECVVIRGLDAQKEHKKAIYGCGFLLSERAAAERAAAERAAAERAAAERAAAERAAAERAAAERANVMRWRLSPRERQMQAAIGRDEQ